MLADPGGGMMRVAGAGMVFRGLRWPGLSFSVVLSAGFLLSGTPSLLAQCRDEVTFGELERIKELATDQSVDTATAEVQEERASVWENVQKKDSIGCNRLQVGQRVRVSLEADDGGELTLLTDLSHGEASVEDFRYADRTEIATYRFDRLFNGSPRVTISGGSLIVDWKGDRPLRVRAEGVDTDVIGTRVTFNVSPDLPALVYVANGTVVLTDGAGQQWGGTRGDVFQVADGVVTRFLPVAATQAADDFMRDATDHHADEAWPSMLERVPRWGWVAGAAAIVGGIVLWDCCLRGAGDEHGVLITVGLPF